MFRAPDGMHRGKILHTALARFRAAFALAGSGLAGVLLFCASGAADDTRTLSIYNIHTKETLTVTYKRDGEYDKDALKKINHMMRDWRRDEATEMDRELIDLIWELHTELGSTEPVHLISGYRSRATNNKLRRAGGGQARNSRHILGKAADIHFPDVPVKKLRNSALIHEMGGVGYYPTSNLPFVHVDTGHVRHWPRLPRQELALLFPSGKTQHVPSDGRPITKRDYEVALAKLDKDEQRTVLAMHARRTEEPTRPRTAEPEKPRPMLASLSPARLPWARGPDAAKPQPASLKLDEAPEATAALPRERARPLSRATPRLDKAQVATAPDYDEEHPEELSYRPFGVTPLMRDRSVSHDAEVASFVHPDQANFGYLLTEPERGLPLRLENDSGRARMADASRFTGPAVINLLARIGADEPLPVPAEQPQPMRTADTSAVRRVSYGGGLPSHGSFGFSFGFNLR